MKPLIAILLIACATYGGIVGLPTERMSLPLVVGDHTVVVWDHAAQQWAHPFEEYDHSGVYEFKVVAWNSWYWIGLWDNAKNKYDYGKWIGHFTAQ